ncbi:universal stress protein [Salinigranum halophilum]|jgi:nucleotide-binding universal stress UspA family protein|uniref:universal stress protein n=1 Tax=Salinigranum halophilum TaxID=2565931 RepID=UPI00115D4958|nr:universal stress protein [Salinigranum halophilum]
MYDAILVPTDGSAAGDRAVEHAVEFATAYDATVHALYVVDAALYSSLEAGVDAVIDALESEGQAAVDAVADRCEAEGIDVETAVLVGTIHRSIRDYVTDHDIDLVVMGTHGRKGIERFLLGSVTERTVRTSPVPVLTVRAPDEEEGTETADDDDA